MLFEDFANKKFRDYSALVQFSEGKTHLKNIRESSLPPYIINFFECSYKNKPVILNGADFENVLNRAVVFSINYVIKPGNTLLKFLFGYVETRPAGYISERLRYFQFYNYYIEQIENFIIINSPVTISVNQIKRLISNVNIKILEEISVVPNGDSGRLNLVKLLYIFFRDLTLNNPINIKLPKKILSVFFADKGFIDIKERIDGFFSHEIFIQEAIELMKPAKKKTARVKTDADQRRAEQILSDAKKSLINAEASNKDIKIALITDENTPKPEEMIDVKNLAGIKTIRESELIPGDELEKQADSGEEIYSEDLILEAKLREAAAEPLSPEEQKAMLFDELFCEESYRKAILRKIFKWDENTFKEFVMSLLEEDNWESAAKKIDEYYSNNKIKYFSEEAVKFVDIMQYYFENLGTKDNRQTG